MAGRRFRDSKPYRRLMIEAFGGTVHRSPSELTEAGRDARGGPGQRVGFIGHRDLRGGRGRSPEPDIRYALGSVLNHVLLHQTVIGEEALLQMEMAGDTPTMIVAAPVAGRTSRACRSHSCARSWPGASPEIVAAEPASCPSLTVGVRLRLRRHRGMTPLMKMHTLGHDFVPDPIHAGGLRYHGMAPLISHVYDQGLMTAEAVPQTECFSAAVQFARTEGIVAAPEPTHALALAIREAKGPRNRRGNGHPHGTVRTWPLTCRPTTPTSTAGWSTRTSPTLGCPTRWRLCRRSWSGRTACLRSVAT